MFFKKRKTKNNKKDRLIFKDKVPIITLDNSWHQVISRIKTPKIEELEEELNSLLKEQGKLNTDYIEYDKLKKDMLDKILDLTHDAFNLEVEEAIKEIENQQKMVLKINEKTEKIEERLAELDSEIESTNVKLVDESIKTSYKHINENREKAIELEEEIHNIRTILLKKTDEKKAYDKKARMTYQYLHQLVGPNMIEQLDELYLEDKGWEQEE